MVNIYLPYDLDILFLGDYQKDMQIYAHKNPYKNMHSHYICKNPKVKVTQMSITLWLDKQVKVEQCNEIQLGP